MAEKEKVIEIYFSIYPVIGETQTSYLFSRQFLLNFFRVDLFCCPVTN